MTAFNKTTQLPTSVTTLERLLAWAVLTTLGIYGAKTYPEVEGELPAPVISGSIVRAADGTTRLIGRYSIKMAAGYDTSVNKLWVDVDEFGTTDIPSAYTT